MPREHMTYQECRTRYPRLVRAMKWVAILSDTEAACAIRDYRDGYGDPGYGSEAVAHYGGPLVTIRRAIECRHRIPR